MQTRSDIFNRIRDIFKNRILSRFDINHERSYLKLTENMPEHIDGMLNFVEHKLEQFIFLCMDTFENFTEQDRDSIGSGNLTENAAKFIKLFDFLEKNKFIGIQAFNKPINLWSGTEGWQKAIRQSDELVCSKVPSVVTMYDLCWAVQEINKQDYEASLTLQENSINDDLAFLISSSVSAYFATYATKTTNVYISSDKNDENAGFTVFNNFWSAELPILLKLHKQHLIDNIQIHLLNKHDNSWQPPISYFSEDINHINIWRRLDHPLDIHQDGTTINRSSITLGAMKRVVHEWHMRTVVNKSKRLNVAWANTDHSIENVIFDIGGVVLDLDSKAVIKKIFPSYDTDFVLKHTFRSDAWISFDKGDITEEEIILEISKNISCQKTMAKAFLELVKESWTLNLDTIKLMDELYIRGIKMYALTNMPASIQSHLRNRFIFWHQFEAIIVSSIAHISKPDISIFSHFIERTAVNPSRSVFIDDRLENTQAAKQSGLATIHFKNTNDCRHELQDKFKIQLNSDTPSMKK